MDTSPLAGLSHPLVVTGMGSCLGQVDATPYLKARKMLKFMGKQDQMAVVAASQAMAQADRSTARVGLYLAVGYIPFEQADVEALAHNSVEDGSFSMERFSTTGIDQVNPLLTFRCLPNMPSFHVSLNLGIQGPYFITYPGIGQFYQALEQAAWALREGEVDLALVGAVADQDNFLVDYQCSRLPQQGGNPGLHPPAVPPQGGNPPRQDVAAFLCLERESARPLWHLESLSLDCGAGEVSCDGLGPASLAYALAQAGGDLAHEAFSSDGFRVASRWRCC